MERLANSGVFRLFETPKGAKILVLNNLYTYAWIHARRAGDLLVYSHNPHTVYNMLALGRFKLYDTDVFGDYKRQQLELEIDDDYWKAYSLPSGLPTPEHPRSRIVPWRPRRVGALNGQAALPV